MKTYVLTVSQYFPKTHQKSGSPTYFVENIMCGIKKHTIRANYELWANRIHEVQEGKAIISLRFWTEKPYRSKQREFYQIDKSSGVGIQKLENPANFVWAEIDGKKCDWGDIAKNDGLEFKDFCEWFKNYDLSKPMAVIHFTNFNYKT